MLTFIISIKKNKYIKKAMLDRMNLFEIYKYPENESLLNKKRFRNKGMRKDNIKIRLMRSFLNNALLNEINEKLKYIDSKIFLKKLPQMFVYNVIKKINKELINMTFIEILEKKDLYDKNELNKYYHNLKVLKIKEINDNDDLKEIVNKKFVKLFEEYINSDKFKIDEINRLKVKNKKDNYIKNYIYFANNFIKSLSLYEEKENNFISFDASILMNLDVDSFSLKSNSEDPSQLFLSYKEENRKIVDIYDFLIEDKDKKTIFKVIYPEKVSIFKNSKQEKIDNLLSKCDLKKRIKSVKKLKRYECKDNIRKTIKRRFLNTYLKNGLNDKIKKAGYNLFFEYYPQKLVSQISREKDKQILEMKLLQIFENKDLYDEKNLNNYYHNLKVIEQLKLEENPELDIILNKKYKDLFDEYINSDEFKIKEINRLKETNKDDNYIAKYIYLSKNFIEFCSQDIKEVN